MFLFAFTITCLLVTMESRAFSWEKWGNGKKWGRRLQDPENQISLSSIAKNSHHKKWNIGKGRRERERERKRERESC